MSTIPLPILNYDFDEERAGFPEPEFAPSPRGRASTCELVGVAPRRRSASLGFFLFMRSISVDFLWNRADRCRHRAATGWPSSG